MILVLSLPDYMDVLRVIWNLRVTYEIASPPSMRGLLGFTKWTPLVELDRCDDVVQKTVFQSELSESSLMCRSSDTVIGRRLVFLD